MQLNHPHSIDEETEAQRGGYNLLKATQLESGVVRTQAQIQSSCSSPFPPIASSFWGQLLPFPGKQGRVIRVFTLAQGNCRSKEVLMGVLWTPKHFLHHLPHSSFLSKEKGQVSSPQHRHSGLELCAKWWRMKGMEQIGNQYADGWDFFFSSLHFKVTLANFQNVKCGFSLLFSLCLVLRFFAFHGVCCFCWPGYWEGKKPSVSLALWKTRWDHVGEVMRSPRVIYHFQWGIMNS